MSKSRSIGIASPIFGSPKPREDNVNPGCIFPAGLPKGHARNITPNGTVCEGGPQGWGANSYNRQGTLGTRPTASPFNQTPPVGNRTGEDAGKDDY